MRTKAHRSSAKISCFFVVLMATTTVFAQQPAPHPAGPAAATAAPPGGANVSAAAAPAVAPSGNQDPNIGPNGETIPGFLTPFDYDPRGRRDPFQQPTDEKPVEQGQMHGPFLPLQKWDLTQIKLSGIIWDVSHPKAMLSDPDGKVYIVGPNTKIGKNNGYIAVIREGELVIVETTEESGRLLSATRILRLPTGAAK